MAKQATVFNKTTGERKVVTVGDPNAFAGGFELETPENKFQGGSLKGTLTSPERSLPKSTSGIGNFKEGLAQIEAYNKKTKDTPTDIIASLGTKLGNIMNPDVMTAGLGDYSALQQRGAASIFKSSLDLIGEQEQHQANYLSSVMSGLPKSFLSTMSGKDYDEIRSGNVSPELKERISEAQTLEDSTSIRQATVSEQLAAKAAGYEVVNGQLVGKLDKIDRGESSGISATAEELSNAIKQVESGGNYTIGGASGEYGAYQFMPGTWANYSSEYLQSIGSAPMSLEMTPANQDAVAKFKIQQLLSKGYSPEQVASTWNSGGPDWIGKTGVNSQGVAYDVPSYVKKVMGNLEKSVDSGLSPEQELQAASVAKEIFGVRGASKPENIKKVTDLMDKGYTADKIQDMLKYSGQSELMSGAYRDAATSVTSTQSFSKEEREFLMDGLDRLLENNNVLAAKELLKKSSIDSLGTEEAKTFRGKERTVEFINEIWNDLKLYEEEGGNTNIFTGTIEQIANKVGNTTDPDLVKIGTKISMALQQYRRSMTGVAFSPGESAEYEKIFPNIKKVKNFNRANIEALKTAFGGDLEYIYKKQMGSNAYDEIFNGDGGTYSLVLPNGETATFKTLDAMNKFKENFDL